VNELDADRSFADRGGDALDASRAHVPNGEHAGEAGLEHVRRPREWSPLSGEIFRVQIGSGFDEPLAV
jgi:hypothetical protein